jgi:hypothetical protein
VRDLLKHPSAWIPIALSLAALAIIATKALRDQGNDAHLFQLLMAFQILIAAFFAVRWLPRSPRYALPVLGVQTSTAVAALLGLYFLT